MTELANKSIRVFDLESVRADFPILQQQVNGKPLVYLDNAATNQKPNAVIDAICQYYREDNSNVHRGAHSLSDRATEKFEHARTRVSEFINSASSDQLIWTRGTTESINLVANTWGLQELKAGDRILVSMMEHHSNIVPWQLVAEKTGARVEAIPMTQDGEVDLPAYREMLDERVKLISIAHVSNALGTVHPITDIIAEAKKVKACVLIDGAQAIAHVPVDVQALGCDFYAFSGHKMFGPTGIGGLWGKRELLDAMPPYQGGGEMIETVTFEETRFNVLPYKFEAGTPDIAGAIGLAAAIDYIESFDRSKLMQHEHELLAYCLEQSKSIEGLRRIGSPKNCAGVFSFIVEGTHPSDIGMLLDQEGVAVRTGHHCTQPLMNFFDIPGSVRASFSIYNTKAEVDTFFKALVKALSFLR